MSFQGITDKMLMNLHHAIADRSLCGYTVTDGDGEESPCDMPATGWRWYQDVEHEDTIDGACDQHRNAGGALIAGLVIRANAARIVLQSIHEWATEIADHYGDDWDHTPACQGEPGCPLCEILAATWGPA